jgi:hypothetical protein
MHFRILVEGDTEQLSLGSFFKKWLDSQLSQPIGICITKFKGCDHYLKDVKATANTLITVEEDLIAVIGLLDLYGLPETIYNPNKKILKASAQDRANFCKVKIEKQVNETKFHQFFALHEIEAWLLSDPSNPALPNQVKVAISKIKNPEEVNFDNPPAKFLNQLYDKAFGKGYKKKTDGSKLFADLNPDEVYIKCPNFKVTLDKMLELAKQPAYKTIFLTLQKLREKNDNSTNNGWGGFYWLAIGRRITQSE